MVNFIESVCKWNSVRYEQIEDKNLNVTLLTEEFLEFINNSETVDNIDALVDTMYINIGCLYKMGLSAEEISKLVEEKSACYANTPDTSSLSEVQKISSYLYKYIKAKTNEDKIDTLVELFLNTYYCMFFLLNIPNDDTTSKVVNEFMMAICTANDTKTPPSEKVDPSIKANVNKGENFVAPEAAIKRIIEENINMFCKNMLRKNLFRIDDYVG